MRRVAHDLHDGPIQTLTVALLELRRLLSQISDDNASRHSAKRSAELIEAAVEEIREIVAYHRPAALDEPSVGEMVRVFLEDVRKRHPGVQIEGVFTGDGGHGRLTDSVRIAVFRIVQEAVTNALAHARASTIRVVVRFAEDVMYCSIEDDGCGMFDVGKPSEAPAGHGLVSMRDRAELLGAEFAVRSEPGDGTIVSVRFPI